MIKRNDLAKQFELVVQQEIKNHNDQMLATNLNLNKHDLDICKITERIDGLNSRVDSEILRISSSQDSLKEYVASIVKGIDSSINDVFQFYEKSNSTTNKLANDFAGMELKVESLKNEIATLKIATLNINESIEKLSKTVIREVSELRRTYREEIAKAKDEITSLPSEAQSVKKEISERLNVDRVDFSGLLKELRGYKKETFIQEKKLENLYTLIDRLDKRIPT